MYPFRPAVGYSLALNMQMQLENLYTMPRRGFEKMDSRIQMI
jgi:hypothetical protein